MESFKAKALERSYPLMGVGQETHWSRANHGEKRGGPAHAGSGLGGGGTIVIKYTICFVRSGDRLLLLNRDRAPNLGLWNGVGGRLEEGESPRDCILREVAEETGIRLRTVRYAGLVTWGDRYDHVRGGMYAYLADVPDPEPAGPLATAEGILAWKELAWVLDPVNEGVVSNIQRFLPVMLHDPTPYRHHCVYRQGLLKVCIRHPLPAEGELASQMEGS